MYSFAEGLVRTGKNVTVITGVGFRNHDHAGEIIKTGEGLFYKKYKANGITIISINDYYAQKLSFPARLLSFLLFVILSIYQSFRHNKTALVFATSTPLTVAIPAILLAKIKRIPFLFEVRDLWPEAPIQMGLLKNHLLIKIAGWLEISAYNNACTIIAVSSGICEKIAVKTKTPTVFIPHGVESYFFEKDRESLRQNTEWRVIYAGSCGFNNAIEVFVEVARLFSERKVENVNFVIVGSGPALDILTVIPPNLELKGSLSKDSVVSELLRSDVALFSQRRVLTGDFKKDSLPNKFFDFIGAGLPIVAGVAMNGEMDRIIRENEIGITAESEDVEALYSALISIVNDPVRLESMSLASKKLSHQFSRSAQVEKFVNIVEQYAR